MLLPFCTLDMQQLSFLRASRSLALQVLGGILVRFWVHTWSFWCQKVAQMLTKIDAKMGIEKSSFRGGTTPRNLPRLVPGAPPLNVGVNLLPWTLVGLLPPERFFFCVFFVFVFVMVLHGFLDQFKCHKLSSRVGAVHVL